MALVAGGIGQTQILVFQRAAPFAIQDFLQFSDVQNSGYALTDSTDYLARSEERRVGKECRL